MPSLHLLIKPASAECNMRCGYCFYTDAALHREKANCGKMSADTLEKVLKKTLRYASGSFSITFQGGEPTLVGLDFYKEAIEMVKKYNQNHCSCYYSIQTNGLILNKEWACFLAENNFLVGISLDGYKELHDENRKDNKGNGTYSKVMDAIALLKKYGVEFHILTAVHRETAKDISKIYNFYKRNGFVYQQYIECLEPLGEPWGAQAYSLTPEQYGEFLIRLYRKWYRDMIQGHYVYIRYFDNLLGILAGRIPESCSMLGSCSSQWVIEADGSVYPCDFYAVDDWKLGNLITDGVEEIEQRRAQLNFIRMSEHIPTECRKCCWYQLCRNGCRRCCEPVDQKGREKNYFCQGYKEFFSYAIEGLMELKDLWVPVSCTSISHIK
ncbi:MAG: anaerobic sulfatase maturase [Lachnospiraceae bacterium]